MRWARGDDRSWFIYKISINKEDNNSAYFVIQFFVVADIGIVLFVAIFEGFRAQHFSSSNLHRILGRKEFFDSYHILVLTSVLA